MQKWLFCLILIVLVVGSIVYSRKHNLYVESNDGRSYLVRNMDSRNEASDTISKLRKSLKDFILHLYQNKENYPKNKNYIDQLYKQGYTTYYRENTKQSSFTSYTVNKGEEMVFCLRSKNGKNSIHDFNLIMYVALHEISHIACPEFGHTPLFNDIFVFLREEAEKFGIYKEINFNQNQQEYCGMNITN
jgi:hypothetical protein